MELGGTRMALMACAGAVLLGGCSQPPEETTRTPTASASKTTPGPRAQALAAYTAMLRDFATASRTSDHESPMLERHAAGDALALIRQTLRLESEDGIVGRGAPVPDPRIVSTGRGGQSFAVRDCADATNWLRYTEDGKPANDEPGGKHRIDATVTHTATGDWKVTELHIRGVGTCT